MTRYRRALAVCKYKKLNDKVELGYNVTYAIKGVGSTCFQLEPGTTFHIEEILYVLGSNKNLLSVAVLEDKGYIVTYTSGKALMWPTYGNISSIVVIGI